jgi:hypothetical protein
MKRRFLVCWPALPIVFAIFILSCGDDNGEEPNADFEFTPNELALALMNVPYSQVVSVSGGTPPYTWDIIEGAVPPGMVTDPADESFTIAGTPSNVGTFSFTLRAEDDAGKVSTRAYSIGVVQAFILNGNWSFTIDVTAADGVCAGEENSPPATDTITVTEAQSGDPYVTNVTMSGFLGNPSNVLTGTRTGSIITVSGSYPEDGGTTTTTHNLYATGESALVGEEIWSWSGPGGDCPNGRADVTAVRQ